MFVLIVNILVGCLVLSNEERFWEATVEELSQGFYYDGEIEKYTCLFCYEAFENGVIYPMNGRLLEAKKAVAQHIINSHGSPFDYLLSMDKKYTGLSDHQKQLLICFKAGLNDKEIVKEMDGGSPSTVRNHRFKFREKEKQAKIYLAIMNVLNNQTEKNHKDFIQIHKGAKMVDDRYAITVDEKEKVLETYFKQGLNGPLDSFPSKEKRKIIILQHILSRFTPNKQYTENEVNTLLKSIYTDFATIRRYLIEYGFMERSKDCTEYWVKQ